MTTIIEGEIKPAGPNKPAMHINQPAVEQLSEAGHISSARPGQTEVLFQASEEQAVGRSGQHSLDHPPVISSQRTLPRDWQRWPETGGFPPIMGGSGKDPDREVSEANTEIDKQRYLTVKEAAELLGVTPGRVRGMVAYGQLPAEKRKVQVVMEKLFIPIEAVEAYKDDPKRKYAPKRHRGHKQ